MRDLGVIGVVTVVVEGVVGRVHVGKGGNSNGFRVDEMLLHLPQVRNGMVFDEEIRRNSHSDESIGSESLLIVSQRRTN